MTDTNGGTSAPQTDTDAQLQRPGDFMRARREEAGMSQAQVGEALHLTVHYVKSLENDDYGKLPGLTFVKGYFRAYARLLKLDENVVLEIYDRYVGSLGLQETVQQHTLRVRRRNDQAILWAVVAGLILGVGLGAGWWFFGREESAAPRIISSPQPSPAVQATAPAGSNAGNAAASNTGNAATSTGGNNISTSQVPASTIAAPVVTNTTATDATAVQTGSNLVSAEEAALAADLAADPREPAGVDVLDAAQGEGVLPPEGANVLITEDGPVVLDETGAGNVPATTAPQSATAAPAAPATTPETVPETTPAPAQNEAGQGTVPGDGAAISSPTGSRRVELSAAGEDRLELQFSGNSWVEVDDGRRVRLYGNMMQGGDTLSIKAGAPFYVLLGDATGVAVQLNGQAFGIASSIRSDNTARVRISAEGVSPWMVQ